MACAGVYIFVALLFTSVTWKLSLLNPELRFDLPPVQSGGREKEEKPAQVHTEHEGSSIRSVQCYYEAD